MGNSRSEALRDSLVILWPFSRNRHAPPAPDRARHKYLVAGELSQKLIAFEASMAWLDLSRQTLGTHSRIVLFVIKAPLPITINDHLIGRSYPPPQRPKPPAS